MEVQEQVMEVDELRGVHSFDPQAMIDRQRVIVAAPLHEYLAVLMGLGDLFVGDVSPSKRIVWLAGGCVYAVVDTRQV